MHRGLCMVRSVQRSGDYAMNHQRKILSSPLVRCCKVRDSVSFVYNSVKNMILHSVMLK